MAEFDSYAHGTPCWVDVTSPDLDGTITFSDIGRLAVLQDPAGAGFQVMASAASS